MATPPHVPSKPPHQPDSRQSQQQPGTQRPPQPQPGTQQRPPQSPAAAPQSTTRSEPVSGGPVKAREPQHDQPQSTKTSTGDKLEEAQINKEAKGGGRDHAREEREAREKHEAEDRQRRERGDEKRGPQGMRDREDDEDDDAKKRRESGGRDEDDDARKGREARERSNRESHSDEHPEDRDADKKEGKDDDKGKEKKPKRAILPEGQAYTLFYNGHKIARESDPPTQWLSMGRLGDGSSVVQSPMTPDLEKQLKEGKFYLAEGVSDDPPAPKAHHDPL